MNRTPIFEGKPDEYVADFLANNPENSGQAHLARAEFLYRQTQYQKRQAEAAEEEARAAERAADATARYTRLTLGLLLASLIATAAAIINLIAD